MAFCDVCGKNSGSRTLSGVSFCGSCFEKLNNLRTGDPELVLHYAASKTGTCHTQKASEYMYQQADIAAEKNGGIEAMQKAAEEARIRAEAEQKAAEEDRIRAAKEETEKRAFAKSFGEFYEYEVITVPNDGCTNEERLKSVLQGMAKNGWRLHTIYSNELGKNSTTSFGTTINSTASEDVMIFERRIQNN